MLRFKEFVELREGKLTDAVKAGIKKDWKKKVALALAPGPFTPVALAMTARDIYNAYKTS